MADNTTTEAPFNIDTYIDNKLGPDPHRKLSELKGEAIHLPDVRKATHAMRTRIDEVFRGFTDTNFESVSWESEEVMRQEYVDSLKQIPADNPIVDTSLGIESYLHVNTAKHPAAIKQEIEENHPEGSIPRSYLKLMSGYEETFGITPQESATLIMKYVTASLPQIHERAILIKVDQQVDDTTASRLAFQQLVQELPAHIDELRRIQSNNPDKQLSVAKAQAQLFLSKKEGKNSSTEIPSILLSKEDKDGLVKAYHIQDRPYTDQEVLLAAKLLDENKHLRSSLIAFHQMFIDYSFMYLQRHPERMNQNLEPYNTIFLPIRNAEGMVASIAPNPKLLKTMANNWLPAVARQLLQTHTADPSQPIQPHEVKAEHIEKGIRQAESYSIFSSIIGEFVQTENPNTVEWKGSFPIACPAKNMFTQSGASLLPHIYDYLKVVQK